MDLLPPTVDVVQPQISVHEPVQKEQQVIPAAEIDPEDVSMPPAQ